MPKKGNKNAVGNKGRTNYRQQQHEKLFISSAVRDALRKKIADGKNPSTYLARIAERLVDTAANGKKASDRIAATKEIMDRLEGKPSQRVEVTGKNRGPITMITREMSDAEAARIVQGMLRDDDEDD